MPRLRALRARDCELRQGIRGRSVWCYTCAAALILYASTANRGAQWQDSGWQQLRIVSGEIEHPYGLPLYHPLQYYLGRAAIRLTFLEPAFAITLVSSLAGAVAIANVAVTIVVLTRRRLPALIAAGALLLSHTLWQHTTQTESYALVAALLSGEWLCLACFVKTGKARYLLLLAFLNGLGIANHLLAALATPVDLAVIVWAWRRGRHSGRVPFGAGVLWLAGTAPYSLFVIARLIETHDVGGTVHAALFANYTSQILNTHIDARTLLLSCGYLIYNFPGLTIPLALVGMLARGALPNAIKRAWLAELGLYLFFVVRYSISDQYTFFFPVYMLLTLFAGVGLARLAARLSRAIRQGLLILAAFTAAWTPLVYLATARFLAARGALAALVKNKPYRDGYRAFFVPWGRGADHATRLNDAVRELAGDNGLVLVADHMQLFGLCYAQEVGHISATVEIRHVKATDSDDAIAERWRWLHDARASDQAVVLVPGDRDQPSANIPGALWERRGDIYLLIGLGPPAMSPSVGEN